MSNPNAAYAFNWLVQRGYQPHQAAGVVGNLIQESGVSPGNGTRGGDGGMSHGIAQWNRERLQRLHAFASQQGTTPWNLDTQLGYLDHELKTYEKPAYQALMNAKDVREATRAGISFERPQGWTSNNPEAGHGWGNRYANAQRMLGVPIDSNAKAPPGMAMPAGTNGTYQGPAAPGSSPIPSMVGAPLQFGEALGRMQAQQILTAAAQQPQPMQQFEAEQQREADERSRRKRALYGSIATMYG